MIILLALILLPFRGVWIPKSAEATAAVWSSPDKCSNASSAPTTQCDGTDPILELWSANVSCSSQGDNVSVSYNDNGFTAHSVLPIQVQMKCHRPAEDGDSITHPQNETRLQLCTGDEFTGYVTDSNYVYTFTNISRAGILPGWMCDISACFKITFDDQFTEEYHRTRVSSCNVQSTTESTTAPFETTTSLSTTSTSSMTVAASNLTSVVIIAGTDGMNLETWNIYLPVLATLTITMLCTVLLMGIIFISVHIRRQLARKSALLMYNKQNMVFDPHFYPSVCIDKPSSFSRSPVMSMVSLNMLQNLDPVANVYVKDGYFAMKEDAKFETDSDESDGGSITLSDSGDLSAIVVGETSLNDDISSTRTEIIASEHSAAWENTCQQCDSTCSTKMNCYEVSSSEQSYVQLQEYEHECAGVLSPGMATNLDCPSDDNDSFLKTDVMSSDNQSDQFAIEAEQEDNECFASEHVHTSTPCKAEVESILNVNMPPEELQSNLGCGYTQSCAVSLPVEIKDEPASTNVLDWLLSSAKLTSDGNNKYKRQDCHSLRYTAQDCQEQSVYFHLPNFHSLVGDHDYVIGSYLQDMLSHASINNMGSNKFAYDMEMDEANSTCHIYFHPPTRTDNDTATNLVSGECFPVGEERDFRPTSPLCTVTNSLTSDELDLSTTYNGYVPSELFTRQVLIPASHDSPTSAAGFVVHLDFESKRKVSN